MIADANGLMGDETLSAGQVLTIPNKVHNSHKPSDVFRVYDPNEAIGNNSPTAPKPQKHHSGGCGGIGQILIAVIAIAVAAVVFPLAAAALGFEATATGIAAASFGQVFAAGAIAGAAGSIVSQGVGLSPASSPSSTGARWRCGDESGVSAGVGKLVPGVGPGSAFLRGVLSSAATQGIAVATGLQKKFDWAGVAAAGVSGGVSAAAGGAGLGNIAANFVGGIAAAATRSLITGTDFGDNLLAVLPGVIGSTIGNAVAEAKLDIRFQPELYWTQ